MQLDPEQADARVLSDDEVAAVAWLALRVQRHFGPPQYIEWAMSGRKLWLLEARPITTLTEATDTSTPGLPLRGLAAAPGEATGRVRILTSPTEGAALEQGDVLVTPMTNLDWLPTIRRAVAVVTDSGGMTCDAAIMARELGVPCVVGTREGTTALHDGQRVTVDGAAGDVLAAVHDASAAVVSQRAAPAPLVPLGTRLYVNLATPDLAEQAAALPVDGGRSAARRVHAHRGTGRRHPRDVLTRGEQISSSPPWRHRSNASRRRSLRGLLSIGPPTCAATSSVV